MIFTPHAVLTLLLEIAAPLAAAEPPGWNDVPALLKRIKAPVFPNRDFDVTRTGAVPDGATDSRKAIVAAIEACSKAGGGRVIFPAGTYLSNGPLHLKSNVNLHLAASAVLRFGVNPDDYLVGDLEVGGGVLTRWEGTRCYNFSPLIYAYRQKNIAITGSGVIDGQASLGWAGWGKRQGPDKDALRKMGTELTKLGKRVFGRGHFLRPSLFQPYECENILLEGVTFKGSPFWTIHPVLSRNVTVRNVTVGPGTTNDDGCDPESCSDVLIEGCTFSTADDNIAIKSGRDNDAWAANGGKPSENIVIRDCRFVRGAPGGVSIGSEMSGDVRNVFIENVTMEKVGRPLYIKANPDRGGVVENIHARNLTVTACEVLLKIEMNYKGRTEGAFPVVFRNIHLENIACGEAKTAFDFAGLAGNPVRDLSIRNVNVETCGKPLKTTFVEGLRIEDSNANNSRVKPPPE